MTRRQREVWAELRTWDVRFWIGAHPERGAGFRAQARAFHETIDQSAGRLRLWFSQNRHWLPVEGRSDTAIAAVNWRFCAALILDEPDTETEVVS